MSNPYIISPKWLNDNLNNPDVSVVDASWYLPNMNRNPKQEFLNGHIPNAVFFDIDEIADKQTELPHMIASPETFANAVSEMGISHTDTIVVYDGIGLFSAPRLWWNLRVMGAKNVAVLDGGFPKWKNLGMPIELKTKKITPKKFTAEFDESKIVSFEDMRGIVICKSAQVADARPKNRFNGEEPEPRPGLKRGHMPNAKSVPATELQKNGRLLPVNKLKNVIEEYGINTDEPVVTTCGSGITAATINLALQSVGCDNHRLYDGSWAQWGARADTEIVQGDNDDNNDNNE